MAHPPVSPYLGGVAERSTLEAVARCVVPHAFEDPRRGERLVTRLGDFVATMPTHRREGFQRALAILGARFAPLLAWKLPVPIAKRTTASATRVIEAWLHSRIAACRTVAQAVRRIILFVEYSSPQAHAEIGYHGPFHPRGPSVPWEGALLGEPSDAEPVARATLPVAASRPAPAPARLTPLAITDANVLTADVVVIGSGAGGAVAAARLAEAGHDVLIVEAGALKSGADFDENESRLHRALYAEQGQRATDDLGVSIVQGVGVGGGTTVNWMAMLRTPEWVLDEWATYHGTEGMRAADLLPWFEKVEAETHTRTVPDDAHSPSNRVILSAAAALGYSAVPARINAHGCVRTGFCGHGCRVGAKQDGLHTYLPRAQKAEARLLTHARAERIDFVERSGSFPRKRISLRHTPPGHVAGDVVVEAPVVVIAAGAVETPVLLQRSALASEAVGKYLRLHPTTGLLGLYDHEMYAAGGIPLSAVCDEFLQQDPAGYGSWIECPPMHPALAAASIAGFGARHRGTMMEFANLGPLIVLTRDGANRGVSNGEVRAREDGTVSIRYALDPADAAHMEAGLVAAARLHFAAGATEVCSGHSRPVVLTDARDAEQLRGRRVGANEIALFSAHVHGTCRMGSSRRSAGCDPNGEVFGAPGVFVADGSLMPTAPGVNPQETIMVLASVVAERIAARRRPG
jgi:choline dehydrogenase-like flavoprotein